MVTLRRIYSAALGGVGVAALGGIAYYATSRASASDATIAQATSTIVGPSASSLSGAIVDSVLKDATVVDKTVDLVAKAFLHPTATRALKDHFVAEFTDNEDTLRALKKFIVNDVIQDPWVSEELIGYSKLLGMQLLAEPTIWPGQSLALIKDAALEGLEQERFKEAALNVAKSIVV